MKTKKGKLKDICAIDKLYKSNPGAIKVLDLVSQFPLKDPIKIVTKTSDWQIIKKNPTDSKGVASFVRS